MPRVKTYNEQDVIEKAMNLFWKNGYETTSMQMLEQEIGINKFSIYSSFGSKNDIFIESIKCHKQKINTLINKLNTSKKGVNGIKEYFYNFIEFSKDNTCKKECLITNTVNEIEQEADKKTKTILNAFTVNIKTAFANPLKQNKTKDVKTIEK